MQGIKFDARNHSRQRAALGASDVCLGSKFLCIGQTVSCNATTKSKHAARNLERHRIHKPGTMRIKRYRTLCSKQGLYSMNNLIVLHFYTPVSSSTLLITLLPCCVYQETYSSQCRSDSLFTLAKVSANEHWVPFKSNIRSNDSKASSSSRNLLDFPVATRVQ